jgi:cytochrome c553
VLPGDLTAVAADPDRDQIYVVNLTQLTPFTSPQVTFVVPLQPGDEPGRVIADGAGRVHVALRGGGALVTLDPASGTILQRRPVCAAPRGLAYDERTDLVHVACASGELVSFPSASGSAVRRLQLDSDLRDVVVQGDLLRVSRFRSAEILTLDSTGAVTARTRPGTFRAATARGGQSFSPGVAWRMVGTHDGGVAMVHQRGVDDPIQRGQPGQVVRGSYGGGNSSRTRSCDGIVHSAISRMKPDGSVSTGPALPDLPLPVDMAVSADGRWIAMVSAGNDGSASSAMFPGVTIGAHVSDIDLASGGTSDTCLSDAGSVDCWGTTPPGAPYCGSGKTVSGQLIAVAFLSSGTLVLQSREPASLNVGGQSIVLSADSRNDTGHTLFHMNAGAGLACASCHSEGLDDGRVWNFTCTGSRRTQSMQTGLRGTEPFHWDGDERSFTQLASDVFTGRMSGPDLSAEQSDTILTWLDAQPRVKVAPPIDSLALAAVERGRALFNRPIDGTSCASCHSGPQLTNAKTVDVGTGGALQVPSLVGLATHAPYMHTGCAATLLDRFTPACGGGDLHGKTSGLAATDLADLVSYLQTL